MKFNCSLGVGTGAVAGQCRAGKLYVDMDGCMGLSLNSVYCVICKNPPMVVSRFSSSSMCSDRGGDHRELAKFSVLRPILCISPKLIH